jgi:anti-sigma factor RsiW
VKKRCREVMERLVEAITGPVPPQDRVGIAEHLAACGSCRNEAAAIEASVARLRQACQFNVPPGFWENFTDRLNVRLAADRLPMAARLRRWLAIPRHAWGAAAVTVVVVLAVSAAVRFGPAPSPQDPVLSNARALMTESMTTTLPSLVEVLDTWRAGMPPEADLASDRRGP